MVSLHANTMEWYHYQYAVPGLVEPLIGWVFTRAIFKVSSTKNSFSELEFIVMI